MKKILFSLCLITTLFCSCSNDDNEPGIDNNEPGIEIPKNPLIGSWEITHYGHTHGIGDEKEFSKYEYLYAGESDYYPNLIIKEDGTLTAIDFVKQNGTPSYYDGKYLQVGNKITIAVEDEGEVWITEFDIEKLTDNEFVISWVENSGTITKYYYKKKEFVEKSIQELILGEWDFDFYSFSVDNEYVDRGNDYGEETVTHLSISSSAFVMTINNDADDVEVYSYVVKDHTITLYKQNSVYWELTIDFLDSEGMTLEMPYNSSFLGEGIVRLSFDKK